MILHTITLAWNRKRQNGLLLLEMIGSFLVLFAVCAAGLAARDSLQTPLGFEYERIWSMQVRVPPGGGGSASDRDTPVGGEPSRGPSPETVLREVESLEAVESAAIAPFPLFSSGGMRTSHESNGERFSTEIFPVSLEAAETLGIELAEGDWFRPGDGVDAHRPVVVNRMLADQLFGTGSHPVGEIYTPPGDEERRSLRILGIVEHFRKTGDLGREDSLLFDLVDTEEVPQFGFFRVYMQMRPGTDASTEEALLEHMRSLAPTWGFQVDWLEEERQAHLRTGLLPLFVAGVVALFLLMMVGLGLTGVLWQNVTRRTRELGLRRAQGATASEIRWLILLEVTVSALLAIAVGGVLAAQLPLFGLELLAVLDSGLFFRSFLLSSFLLVALTTLCGLYPSWLATRIHPAEALAHE